jgi:HAD superfamily hydrolase (TIGR01484 family)
MQPLPAMPAEFRRAIRGVLCDIDDTLSTAGRITSEAYAAMARLRQAGLLVIPITGRPAGWCDQIARMWPVDAVVGENGAVYMRHDDQARKLRKRYAVAESERRENKARLMTVAERILREVPGCSLASDQPYRECDLAIDYCEDVPPLPQGEVDRIVAMMRTEGLTAKVSSIHVNGWLGDYDKLTMTRRLLREEFAFDLEARRSELAFVGDSPNDESMFGFFPGSVGVANLRRFATRLATPPRYLTAREAGAGFAELTDFLLSGR